MTYKMEIIMNKKLIYLLFIPLLSFSVSAATITADFTNISGNTYQAEYTVENDSLASTIDEFTIWFDLGLYENISTVFTPTDWDPLVIQPDASIPDDGFYDVLALSSGIANGDSLDGFIVSFDWLGGNASMSQYFEIIDPFTFNVLESGNTIIAANNVPEPLTITLLASGLAGMAFSRKRKFTRPNLSLLVTHNKYS